MAAKKSSFVGIFKLVALVLLFWVVTPSSLLFFVLSGYMGDGHMERVPPLPVVIG